MGFQHDVVGRDFGPFTHKVGFKAVARYALGVGATEKHLDLLLETRGPKVLPSYAVIVCHEALSTALTSLGGNMLTLVHGAQKVVVHRPIAKGDELSTTCRVTGLYDKGKGALAVYETKSVDGDGKPVCDTEWQIFYRGEGGFGGERGPETPKHVPPSGQAPDHVVTMPTSKTQALLYRLNGDLNPIHADPAVAEAAGFPGPILHGLCTYGHATLAAVDALTGGDPDKLTSIQGRFSKPVFPGDTIVTKLWHGELGHRPLRDGGRGPRRRGDQPGSGEVLGVTRQMERRPPGRSESKLTSFSRPFALQDRAARGRPQVVQLLLREHEVAHAELVERAAIERVLHAVREPPHARELRVLHAHVVEVGVLRDDREPAEHGELHRDVRLGVDDVLAVVVVLAEPVDALPDDSRRRSSGRRSRGGSRRRAETGRTARRRRRCRTTAPRRPGAPRSRRRASSRRASDPPPARRRSTARKRPPRGTSRCPRSARS